MPLNDNMILVGIKINQRLRNYIDSNELSVKHLLANDNSRSLQILEIDSDDYIAKTIKSGATLEELSNMCMNLKSMLKLIFPHFPLKEDAIKVYAQPPPSTKNGHSGL